MKILPGPVQSALEIIVAGLRSPDWSLETVGSLRREIFLTNHSAFVSKQFYYNLVLRRLQCGFTKFHSQKKQRSYKFSVSVQMFQI